jgi:multidrug transporter EmrE-like cation transporter
MNPTALLFLVLAIAAEVAGLAGLRRIRTARLFHVGVAQVRAGLLHLGPEPQVHYARSRLRPMVGAWHGGLSPVGVLNWNEILGLVHILGIALIVVGVVVRNVVPSTWARRFEETIHPSAWKVNSPK